MTEIIEFDQKKIQQFRQSNALVESVYQATLTEKRILATMISMIHPDHSDFKDYKIDIRKFAEVFDIKGKSILELVKKSTKNLLSRTIQINDGDKFLQINWISSAEYQKGSSDVIIRFDPKLKPYLLNLRGGYTTALLDQVARFKSVYAFRLYELFKQYHPQIEHRTFELLHLKKLLGCENDYPNYGNFKEKVVNKAVYEINNLSDLYITFLELKEGKKVVKLVFTISRKDYERQNDLENIESPEKVIVEESKELDVIETKSQEVQKIDHLFILFEEAFKKYNIGKKIIVIPYEKLKVRFRNCLKDFESAEAFLKQIDDYNSYLEVATWRERKAFSAWINDPAEGYGNDWVAKKDEELKKQKDQLKTVSQKRDDFEFKKVEEIKDPIWNKIRSIMATHQLDYNLYMAGNEIKKSDSGYILYLKDSRALKYQDLLNKINIKIEVK